MDRFRDIISHTLPRKRSLAALCRKHSDTSLNAETILTQISSDQKKREQKCAPYKYPRYEGQLQERGSFMDNHEDGITAESETLCERLLKAPQSLPEYTL